MSNLMLAVVLQAALLGNGQSAPAESQPRNYAEAHKVSQENGQTLVVLIGADWCPGCRTMETSVLPKVTAHGKLKNMVVVHVNTDREGEMAKKLMSGNLIPQLVVYSKSADGWREKRIIGAQSVSAVEEFLAGAVKPATSISKQQRLASPPPPLAAAPQETPRSAATINVVAK